MIVSDEEGREGDDEVVGDEGRGERGDNTFISTPAWVFLKNN